VLLINCTTGKVKSQYGELILLISFVSHSSSAVARPGKPRENRRYEPTGVWLSFLRYFAEVVPDPGFCFLSAEGLVGAAPANRSVTRLLAC
jgi:hypothetical protein